MGAGIAVFGAIGAIRGARLTVSYLVIVLTLATAVAVADDRVRFTLPVLIGLVVWGTAHLAGGLIELDDGRILYNTSVTRWIHFDNAVHFIGFGSAGLAGLEMLESSLGVRPHSRLAWFVTVTAALGAGALNEVIEFAATHLLDATEVGGYENTGRDLVANLMGGTLAATWAVARRAGGDPSRKAYRAQPQRDG